MPSALTDILSSSRGGSLADLNVVVWDDWHGRSLVLWAVLTLVGTVFAYYARCYATSPLRQYPGPALAGWTNLWRLYHCWGGRQHIYFEKLHRQYGPVVRLGPNLLDIDYPELIHQIYSARGDFLKTEFYHASSIQQNGVTIYNLFSQTDPHVHARERRPIAKYYSPAGVAPLEPHMDRSIEILCGQLEDRYMNGGNAGRACDLGDWIDFYTWDVVGETTFSKPFGFLQAGGDLDATLRTAEQTLDYFVLVAQLPALDYWFAKNPVRRIGPPAFAIAGASVRWLLDRHAGRDGAWHDPARPDFLDKFLEAQALDAEGAVDDNLVVSWLMINSLAGADTVAILIKSVLYHALRHPRVWRRLQVEQEQEQEQQKQQRQRVDTDTQAADDADADGPVSYKTARARPYLEAVVREAARVHPPVSSCLERYVPAAGLRLPDGRVLPPGVAVGVNPYVAARNRDVYGDDAEAFRPERWLPTTTTTTSSNDDKNKKEEEQEEDQDTYQRRLRAMLNADLTFGAGSRNCIGRNMALMEVYKVVATLVARYDVALVRPDRPWTVRNSFFVRQKGLEVRLTRRRRARC